MSKPGYRQKPWLYIVTDPVKGWRNLIGRPEAFELDPAAGRFKVTLHDGDNIDPMWKARPVDLILLVPGVAKFTFTAEVTKTHIGHDAIDLSAGYAGPLDGRKKYRFTATIDRRTFRTKPSRHLKRRAA